MKAPQQTDILSCDRHRDLKYTQLTGFGFARDWLSVPVHIEEIELLSTELPILFQASASGRLMPCALLRSGEGSMITRQGEWRGQCIPELLQLYPFRWARSVQTNQVTIDMQAPHFNVKGQRIFTSRGKPTQLLNTVRNKVAASQAKFQASAQVLREIQEAGVLEPLYLIEETTKGEQGQREFYACLQASIPVDTSLSANAKQLLQWHRASISGLLSKAQPSGPTHAFAQVLEAICTRHKITLADLKSRRHSDAIKNAKAELVKACIHNACLDEASAQLGRTEKTLKAWLK